MNLSYVKSKLNITTLVYKLLPWLLYPIKLIEHFKLRKTKINDGLQPVFIVGAPRTGTTLLYQLITNSFLVTYISNFSMLFYHSMTIGIDLHKLFFKDIAHNNFTSNIGKTKFLIGPHESGKFWYRWFNKDYFSTTLKDISTDKYLKLIKTIQYTNDKYELPIVFKNTVNSLRISALRDLFPNALFLYCIREPKYTAYSILQQRIKILGNKNKWWAIKPPNISDLEKLPYYAQVVKQVHYTQKKIENDLSVLYKNQVLKIQYEYLCSDPNKELKRLEEFFENNKIKIKYRQNAKLPVLNNNNIIYDDIDFKLICEEVDKIEW